MLGKKITSGSIIGVVLSSAILSAVCLGVIWDYYRVNRDFRQLKALLTEVRSQTAGKNKTLIVRFTDEMVSVADNDTGAVISTLAVPTLEQVNYDTTIGDDTIVFYKRGTARYNKRVHGGDIRSKR